MQEICDQIHEMWNVEKVAIVHRIGYESQFGLHGWMDVWMDGWMTCEFTSFLSRLPLAC